MNRMQTKQAGFSLIEALISAMLIAVVIMALTRLQVSMLADSGESRTKTHALNLAHAKLEEMRAFGRRDLYDGLAGGVDTTNTASVQLNRAWSVTSAAGYLVANVRVSWTDSEGNAQNVELTSYINAADPVRSGKVLLASIASSGGSSGTGSGSGTGGDTGSGGSDAGNGGTDSGEGGGSSTGDTGAGSGSSDGSTGGGGVAEPSIVLSNYTECVSATCSVSKGGSITVRFSLGEGTTIESVVASNGAIVSSVTADTLVVKAPNGNNKAFTVLIRVGNGSTTKSVTLNFVTAK